MDNAIRNSKHNKCVQNGFVGSIPGHSIVAKYLEITMQHVHDSHYKGFDLFATGPCVLGSAVKEEAKQHNDADKRYAQITSMAEYTCDSRKRICHFYWNNEQIVLHKCEGCGTTQDWELGNNYNTLFQNQNYYCEDSASIFAM